MVPVYITVPIITEVIESNPDSKITGAYEKGALIITIDTRTQNHHQRLGIDSKRKLYWGKEHSYEIQELSSLSWPIYYRVITAEGYYIDEEGKRVYFTTEAKGIDRHRGVSEVLMRAAVLLLVIAGMGYRRVSWLLEVLFHVNVSKSSLQRWIGAVASQLPSGDEIIRLLNEKQPITEGHLDEIFPRGSNKCVLVLKDEHGRILATQEVDKRDEESVKPFLQRMKDLGLNFKAFYTDGCKAYFNAIRKVFGKAVEIQYDYFHIIQNAWRHMWKWAVSHRRQVKEKSENVTTPCYKKKLEKLARSLWDNRYLLFKADDKMTEEEKERLLEIVESDQKVGILRSFLGGVWHIFEDSGDEEEAKAALNELKNLPIDKKEPESFNKVIRFLEEHFEWMTAFLRNEGVKRNSLSETSMRVLRRLEIEHDGFRSTNGREDFLRIYQAIKYLGWTVHRLPQVPNESGEG